MTACSGSGGRDLSKVRVSPAEFRRVQGAVLLVAKSRGKSERLRLVAHLKTLSRSELVAYCDGVLAAALGVASVGVAEQVERIPPAPLAKVIVLRPGKCAECGGPIVQPARGRRLFCGTACTQRSYRRRKKEAA